MASSWEQMMKRIVARIKESQDKLDADIAYRDALILSGLRDGMTEREVAEHAGISHVRVHQIKEEFSEHTG